MPGISLTLLVLKTQQVDRLRAFYQTLGISFVEEQHGKGPLHYAGQTGELTLEIYPLPAEAAADSTTRLGFVVDNVEEVVELLQSQGNAALQGPRQTAWGYRAMVKDPDGRTVELCQR